MAPLENERKQEFIIFTRRQTYHAPFDGKLFITFDEPKKLLTENRGQKHISSEMVWAVRLIKGIICDKYRDKHELSIMIRHYDEFIAMNSILLLYTNNLSHPFGTGFGEIMVQ